MFTNDISGVGGFAPIAALASRNIIVSTADFLIGFPFFLLPRFFIV
jgi:hypothetical protein